ncbi:MAG: response regulator transcription factor [Dehalococcoidales bacterium]|nr:response regulator transcription factor [Dehalococcoidales bacterium]
MRVLLADDHELVRNGIASLLKANNIKVVGEASDGLEALEKARDLKPDVILMDIKMPRCNGLEATRLIKTEMPQIKIIILTVSTEDDDLFEAVRSGAEGYILKNIRAKEFISLLSGVVGGQAALSPTLAARIMEEFARLNTAPAEPAPESRLTERETDILRLVVTGALNKQIALELGITENTVKYHLRNIMAKLHLNNKAQVAAYAVSKGIIPASSPER